MISSLLPTMTNPTSCFSLYLKLARGFGLRRTIRMVWGRAFLVRAYRFGHPGMLFGLVGYPPIKGSVISHHRVP